MTTAVKPAPITSVAQAVRAAAPHIKMRGTAFVTTELSTPYLHCILYGETDARKSVTAAHFGTPDNTRIIMTRRAEQLIGLKNKPYRGYVVADAADMQNACLYPEAIWPEWLDLDPADRTLIVDDMTEGKELFLEANSTIESGGQVRDVRDPRKMYGGAQSDVRDMMRPLLSRRHHLIIIANAKIYTNDISHEETVSPDIPPQMNRMLTTDFEFCFYIDKRRQQILTRSSYDSWVETINNKAKSHSRTIFAKNKLPLEQAKTALAQWEQPDLRAIWNKVLSAGATK